MKFKAFLTDNGINLLGKRILPSLEKTGKTCHLYFTPDHAMFLHNLLNSDGVQSIAQFTHLSLFQDYRISSQNDDKIAFSIDISLLHRALTSILSIQDFNSYQVQIKLFKKLTPHSTQPTPFLTLEAKGFKSAVIQDVPISKSLSRADLQELQVSLQLAQEMPGSLVKAPELTVLQGYVERMKHVGEVMGVSVSKYGDLHLQVSTSLVALGAEFRNLVVLGERADGVVGDGELSAQTRIERAVGRGDAMSVDVSVKHFVKSLQCGLAKPDCAFYGIGQQWGCLIVIFQFFVPGTSGPDPLCHILCAICVPQV